MINGCIASFGAPKPGNMFYTLWVTPEDGSDKVCIQIEKVDLVTTLKEAGFRDFKGLLKDLIGAKVSVDPENNEITRILEKDMPIPGDPDEKTYADVSAYEPFIDRNYKYEFCKCGGKMIRTNAFLKGGNIGDYNRKYASDNLEKVQAFISAYKANPTLHAKDYGLVTLPECSVAACRELNCVNRRFESIPFFEGTHAIKFPAKPPVTSLFKGCTVWTGELLEALQIIRVYLTFVEMRSMSSYTYAYTSSIATKLMQEELAPGFFNTKFVFIVNNIKSHENVIGMQLIEMLRKRIEEKQCTFIIDQRWHEGSQLKNGSLSNLVKQGLVQLI